MELPVDNVYELIDRNKGVAPLDTSMEYNPCYRAAPKKPTSSSKKSICTWRCTCVLFGFILVGSAAFASLGLTLWHIYYQSVEIKMDLMQLQASMSENVLGNSTNENFSDLEQQLIQLQKSTTDRDEILNNISRSFNSDINNIIQSLGGQYSNLPAASCSHIFLSNSFSPSGYYWIRSSNGSAVRVYCDFNRQCGCDGPSTWTRVAFLNMSDPNQVCPSNWTSIFTPVRTCGRGQTSCSSVFYPTFGLTYSRVCGRIIAYQDRNTDGLVGLVISSLQIDQPYVEGVSLTHGSVGSRQHIWSFVSAIGEDSPFFQTFWLCACSNSSNWPHSTSFVGNDYFCDSGNHGRTIPNTFHSDDPLWDSQGCGPSSTCCQFNNPPWFCRTLPQSTTDDLEVRICNHGGPSDTPIQLLELYIT